MPRRSARLQAGLLLKGGLLVTALSVASCSGASSPAPKQTAAAPTAVFNDRGGQAVSCMQHQEQQPTAAYRAGSTAVSELELPMLAYYTSNGDKPYCDGKPATATDRAWLTTYVADGADPTHVRRNLG